MARNISDQRFSAAFIKYRQKLCKPRKHYLEIAIVQMRCSMLFQANKDPITVLEARLGGVPFLQNLLSIYERRLYLNDEELAE